MTTLKTQPGKKLLDQENIHLVKWNEAKVIVSLESDFLGVDGNKLKTQDYLLKAEMLKQNLLTDFIVLIVL